MIWNFNIVNLVIKMKYYIGIGINGRNKSYKNPIDRKEVSIKASNLMK